MKNAVFCAVTPCDSCKNRRFEESIASIIRVTRIGKLGTLAITSKRSALRKNATRATRRHIQEDVFLSKVKLVEGLHRDLKH
jgi:hypothetical protein